MRSVFIQAPTDKVFEPMCDLTRHAKWAAHDISVQADQEGLPAVGHTYTSSHKGKTPDRITITEMTPNERFGFHVIMPNKWELQWDMRAAPQGEGTLVSRQGKITKMPAIMTPMKLLFPLIASPFDKKLLNNMKADLEGAAQ